MQPHLPIAVHGPGTSLIKDDTKNQPGAAYPLLQTVLQSHGTSIKIETLIKITDQIVDNLIIHISIFVNEVKNTQ